MKEFLIQSKQYGFRVAINNALIGFTKWFIGAKKIKITYYEEKRVEKPSKIIKELYIKDLKDTFPNITDEGITQRMYDTNDIEEIRRVQRSIMLYLDGQIINKER